MNTEIYNDKFHEGRTNLTQYSAQRILALLLEIYPIKSVCDIGGGIGVWVKTFLELNEKGNVLCIDGDYIKKDQLVIEENNFVVKDLEDRITLKTRYDLAISLEVAEHLTSGRAESFVEDLTKISDVVLFLGAVKGQGGEGHINEQFMSYWIQLFDAQDYRAFDIIRPQIQDENNIPWWYKQNIMVFVNQNNELRIKEFEAVSQLPALKYTVSEGIYDSLLFEYNQIVGSRWYKIVQKIFCLLQIGDK